MSVARLAGVAPGGAFDNVHAQIGDFVLSELPADHHGDPSFLMHFVDVGSGSGEGSSVTKYMEQNLHHVRGVCIEPRASAHLSLQSSRHSCRTPRVALGAREHEEVDFVVDGVDGESSYLPGEEHICGHYAPAQSTEPIRVTQLSTLVQKERFHMYQGHSMRSESMLHDLEIRRENWIGYLHIDVHGDCMPILLGAMLPLVNGPPLAHEKSTWFPSS